MFKREDFPKTMERASDFIGAVNPEVPEGITWKSCESILMALGHNAKPDDSMEMKMVYLASISALSDINQFFRRVQKMAKNQTKELASSGADVELAKVSGSDLQKSLSEMLDLATESPYHFSMLIMLLSTGIAALHEYCAKIGRAHV